MYIFNEQTFADMTSLAILRNFTSIPLHIVCGIVMGHFIALDKFSKTKGKKLLCLLASFLVPLAIHSIYNIFFSVILMDANTILSLLIVIAFILSIYFIGVTTIFKTSKLNNIFINNGVFKKPYTFLMRKNDYIYSKFRRLLWCQMLITKIYMK